MAHKVVTTPRGRLTGADGMFSDSLQEQRPRPRSLSAPRTRLRAADLVQNLYDRMGVNYQQGRRVSDLSPSALGETPGTTPQPSLSRPAISPSNMVTTPSNSHTIFQRNGGDDDNAVGEDAGGIKQSRSFHESYRVATSRGRATDRNSNPGCGGGGGVGEDVRDISNNLRPRSLSRGRVAQRWPPLRSEEMGSFSTFNASSSHEVQSQTNNNKQGCSPSRSSPARPSWMEAPGASLNNNGSYNISQGRSLESEEKKEEVGQDLDLVSPVPLKDRISIFGTKKGSSSRAVRSRPTRTVDPKYAAQFAVRDLPPKIDIYGNTKDATVTTSEATDSSTVTSPTAANEGGKSQAPQQQPQIPSPSPTSGKKVGSVAMAYISAIQSPVTPSTKSLKSATAQDKTSVLPREIAVSATTDLGLQPNDSQSLAGLSTVSGEDYSNVQNKMAGSTLFKRQSGRVSHSPKNQQSTFSNNIASMPSPPLVSALDDMALERLVEERVKERMTDLESKIETQLSQLVNAMEARVMARLDCIEQKMA